MVNLGFNPLTDLGPLAALPELEDLNLDGALPNLRGLAALTGLKRLSLRHNGIRDLAMLTGLTELEALDVGDNRITDLRPMVGLEQWRSFGRIETASPTFGRWRHWPGSKLWHWATTASATCGPW